MNVRQVTFLRLLLEQEEYLPVSFYAGKLRISDKTVRKMLSGINGLLAAYNGCIHSCPGTGIRLEISGYERERLCVLIVWRRGWLQTHCPKPGFNCQEEWI